MMPNLDFVTSVLRSQAQQAFDAGDAFGFLMSVESHKRMSLFALNYRQLRERGIYEAALLEALQSAKSNSRSWPLGLLKNWLQACDREKLLAAGDPLPHGGPFVLYRGVAGEPGHRRVCGIHWTGSLEKAIWFATRFHLPAPAVYRVRVEAERVWAHNEYEDEYLVIIRRTGLQRVLWTFHGSERSQAG